MVAPVSSFPVGRHFALTWGIPEQFGGMTAALLNRSRNFVKWGGVSVDVLTLDDRPDYPELNDRMLASGELVPGMRVRNLWQDLAEHAPTRQKQQTAAVDVLVAQSDDHVVEHEGVVRLRERRVDGVFAASDRFRADGSLLATERIVGGHRRVVVHDADGVPMRAWKTKWSLYRWWLDRLTDGRLSYLIVDSKTAVRCIPDYRRDHVVTVHLVHGGHRSDRVDGRLRRSREATLRRAADFDAVVVLTHRQREEMHSDGLTMGARVRVIPNAVQTEAPVTPDAVNQRGRGIAVASLTSRKRLTHAVRAVAQASEASAGVSLDIVGTGPAEASLRTLIEDLQADEAVQLRGFDVHARQRFAEADFSILTSESEGLPLVLAEAMANGCIPLAYDIRYGPSDIIRNGVDGFLVPDGDVGAMAQQIVALQRMSDDQVATMRRKAIARAALFSDERVTRLWAKELRAALDAKRVASAQGQGPVVWMRRRAGVMRRRMHAVLGA